LTALAACSGVANSIKKYLRVHKQVKFLLLFSLHIVQRGRIGGEREREKEREREREIGCVREGREREREAWHSPFKDSFFINWVLL
jgi:hypothetical protein